MRHGRHWPRTSRLRPRAGRPRKCTGPVDRFRENPKMRVSQAGIAQLVERNLAKVEVASSSLVSRSRSMVVANPPEGVGQRLDKAPETGFCFEGLSGGFPLAVPVTGLVAEWLCSGLQIRVRRFNSDPGLH